MWPFRNAKSAIPSFDVENTIGAGSCVRGELSGPGGFRIEGSVEGAIDADGPVIIGEGGSIEGNVRGRDVVVLGRVRGDVHASGHLEIGPKGKVLGDVTVQSFRMHRGGVFRGTSCMPAGEDVLPALGEGRHVDVVQRGRTLPPPTGAVPPPPRLAELAEIAPAFVPDEAVSQERLVSSLEDGEETARETGT